MTANLCHLNNSADQPEKCLGLEWFPNYRASKASDLRLIAAGDEYKAPRKLRLHLASCAKEFYAGHSWHVLIADDSIEGLVLDCQ